MGQTTDGPDYTGTPFTSLAIYVNNRLVNPEVKKNSFLVILITHRLDMRADSPFTHRTMSRLTLESRPRSETLGSTGWLVGGIHETTLIPFAF